MSFKFVSILTDRRLEIDKILRDPSLTEEEKKYFQQLRKSIYDAQTEELQECYEIFKKEGLLKSLKDNNYGIYGPPSYNIFDPKEVKFHKKLKKWSRFSSPI